MIILISLKQFRDDQQWPSFFMQSLLKVMPSKELLDRFVRGMTDHSIHVYFDAIKGEFVDDRPVKTKK